LVTACYRWNADQTECCRVRGSIRKCGFPHIGHMEKVLIRFKRECRRAALKCGFLSMRRKVDFIICGTQKSGTTALYSYLNQHHQVCMAEKKELHYFDDDSLFLDGKPDYSEYHSWFSPNDAHKLLGEATPSYMYWKSSPKRIWQYNPSMKILIILRNPIERAYSHWNMQRFKKLERLPFYQAIMTEHERKKKYHPFQDMNFSYVDRGFYLEQLRRIWTYFSKDQVLILKNEYLKHCHDEALNDVCDFLGVDRFENVESKNVHAISYISPLDKKEKIYLERIYERHIREIERELGWDCSDWLGC